MPAHDSYADDTRAGFMRPVPRHTAHDKLTWKGSTCNALRGFATRFPVCLSPRGNGSTLPSRGAEFRFQPCAPSHGESKRSGSLMRCRSSHAGVVELAIE